MKAFYSPTRILWALVCLLLLGTQGCRPTKQNQTRANMVAQENVADLRLRYPHFSPFLDDLQHRADREWARAEQEPNVQQRALMMQRANRIITTNSLYQELRRYEGNVQTLMRNRNLLDEQAVIPEQRTMQRLAVEKATRTIQDADQLVMYSQARTDSEAFNDVRNANAMVRDADATLREVHNQLALVVPVHAAPPPSGGTTIPPRSTPVRGRNTQPAPTGRATPNPPQRAPATPIRPAPKVPPRR